MFFGNYSKGETGHFAKLAVLLGCFAISGATEPRTGKKAKEVCYNKVGCLSVEPPWDLMLGHVPESPDKVGVRFFHRSRAFPVRKEIVEDAEGRAALDVDERIAKNRMGCKVVIHGFASSSKASWVVDLEDALLMLADTDVISVDWSKGAAGPNYLQAVANTRTVAALVSRFLKQLFDRGWCSTSNLHLIGQSLGAHLASYVASNLTNVAEITGLDPAQPWFETKQPETHLDPSDAGFVQVIHTDVLPFWPHLGLGFSKPSGHVDFYLNGGTVQPDCSKALRFLTYFSGKLITKLIGLVEWLACSHLMSQAYYIDSLRRPYSCRYTGIPWSPLNKEPPSLKGRTCSLSTCQQLGLLTKFLPARGSFYVFTNYTDNYCLKSGNETGVLDWLNNVVSNLLP